ncbi:MAG: hypothetical protein ACM3ZO_11460 [Clostridia bacterium]
MGAFEGIIVKTETLRVERVVRRIAREVTLSLCREAPEDARETAGVTVEVLDPVWDVFDGSAVASATVLVWAYCLAAGGLVRAVSWTEDLRVFVEEATLRPGMRIEALFSMELQRAWIDEDGALDAGREAHTAGGAARKVRAVATARIDGLVLETIVLPVVTGVETPVRCGDPHSEERERAERPGDPERTERPAPCRARAEDRRRRGWIRPVLQRLYSHATSRIAGI